MKKILFSGFMASILSIAGAYAATETSLTTKGYVDTGLRWAKSAADTAKSAADAAQADVDSLETVVGGHTSKLTGITTTVTDAIDAAIDAIDNSAVTNLQERMTTAEGDITDINNTLDTYGNIVTHNVAEFATSEQGAKADTALQTTDIIDGLTSTSTEDALSANQGRVLDGKITAAQSAADAAQADVDSLETVVGGHTSKLTGITTTVTDAIDAAIDAIDNSAVTNLQERMTTAEGDITDINNTLDTYGNIVTHNVAEFATSEQGAKADTALQTTDIIDGLTSTSTVDALSANQGRVLDGKITAASNNLTCENGKTCVIVGSAATPVDQAMASDWVALSVNP